MLQDDDQDINDAFDDILFTEERIIEESFKEGFKEGETQGNPEGYHLGYHRGAEIGAELGYYYSKIQQLESLHHKNCSEKVTRLFQSLNTQISNFPEENIEIDILKDLDSIRFSYKKLCALLNVNSTWPEGDKLSF